MAYVRMCKFTAELQMAKAWAAHGKPKGFWQQAFFLLAGVKQIGPPIWLAQVHCMGHPNGFGCLDQTVELEVPLVHHALDGMPILLIVVVDRAVCIAFPGPGDGPGTFGCGAFHALLGPVQILRELNTG